VQKRVCLITGATEGVGKATAIRLAHEDFTVVLATRNASKAEQVRREIIALTGNTSIDYLVADLMSLQQVRSLVERFKERHSVLDVLINNAGAVMPSRALTEDGYEFTYQVNYLSHFLLAQLLLSELAKSRQGRVINLSSSAYTMGRFDARNLQSEESFSPILAYASAKLFVLMSTIELARRLRDTPITVNAVHPGTVRTQMITKAPGLLRIIGYLTLPFAVSAKEGAIAPFYLATSRDVIDVTGHYFARCAARDIRSKSNTQENREMLWRASMSQVGATELASAT
jgi:retinol dehydrogenase-12